jgi:hypothetical protein
MYYTPDEVGMLLRLCSKTVIQRIKAGDFGPNVADIGSDRQADYRIPASGVNAYLASRRVFSEPGIAARSVGELRRKAHVEPVNAS